MPVLTMQQQQQQESSWDDSAIMLPNGEEILNSGRQEASAAGGTANLRTQDDARVSYFNRPQEELNQQYGLHQAIRDALCFAKQALTVSEIEREFHRLSFDSSGDKDSRNPWDKGGGPVSDRSKAMFASLRTNPWMSQEENWVAPTTDALNELMTVTRRRPGSFPGASELPPVMSPHMTDTPTLGINMAEYVLGPSPLGKNMENRLGGMHRFVGGGDADNGKLPVDKASLMFDVDGKQDHDQGAMHMNGSLQNGLDEKGFSRAPGSRQNSPTSVETASNGTQLKQGASISESLLQSCQSSSLPLTGMSMNNLSLDVQSYEMMGYDPFQNHYNNRLLAPHHIPPPTMDSPNFGVDYNQQMMQARHQQQQQQQGQIAMVPSQPPQYALPSDQMLGMTTYASPAGCILNSQDAFGVGMSAPGAAMMTRYYGIQPSWPVYPTGTILQQQQQQQHQQQQLQQQVPMPGTNSQPQILRNQSARPLTPQQTLHDSSAMQTTGGAAAGYQILAAPTYYDQSGQLVMNGGRGIGHLVRLVSPAPLLMNPNPGQQGYAPTGNVYTPASGGIYPPRNNTPSVWLSPQQPKYSGGPAGSSLAQGAIGCGGMLQQTSDHRQRRDSFGSQDFKQQLPPPLTNFGDQFYGASLSPGAIGLLPAGATTMTPPPLAFSLSNSISVPGLGLGSGGRMYSAAPGAEAKFRGGSAASGSSGALFGGASLFNVQQFVKNDGVSKDGVARSQLLEDFRGNRIPNLQLRDLTNHVVEFSQDQHGSRFIQQKLEHASPAEKTMVFTEILGSAYVLVTDVFGNYVIQKFFEFGTQDQKQTLAQRVRGHVLTLALHMYGCRVIQKALESITADLQVEIVKELDGSILKCVKDQNGNHVVQKCIECIDPKHLGFITDAFKGQVLTLAMHPYGCRVIQRILEHCTADQVKSIMDELLLYTEHLVHDQYGNYVVQHILEHGQPDDKSKIIKKLCGKMMALSQHKFASNVVEKCVSHSSRAERAGIIEEVCNMNDGPQSALYTMMKDQFANYVVQKMIDLAEPPQRKLLLQKIRPHISILRRYAYGKHILAKLEKFYSKNNAELGPIGVVPSSAVQ